MNGAPCNILADRLVSSRDVTVSTVPLTFDALVVRFLALVTGLKNPISVANHMLIQLIAVFGVNHVTENDHAVLMETFQSHLEIWNGITTIFKVFWYQGHAARAISLLGD